MSIFGIGAPRETSVTKTADSKEFGLELAANWNHERAVTARDDLFLAEFERKNESFGTTLPTNSVAAPSSDDLTAEEYIARRDANQSAAT